jgi:hypothetical protein
MQPGNMKPFVDGSKLFIFPKYISGSIASFLYIYSVKFTSLIPQATDTCIFSSEDRTSYVGVRMYLTPDGNIKITRGTPRPEDLIVELENVNLDEVVIEGTYIPTGWGSLDEYTYNDKDDNIITKQFRMEFGYGSHGFGAHFSNYNGRPINIDEYSVYESCQMSLWSLYGWTQGVGSHHHCADITLNRDQQMYYLYNRSQEIIESGSLVLYQR